MLNKESKTGTIKKIDVKHLALIGATIGILAVSVPNLSKSISNNSRTNSFDSREYTTYSQQVEDVYGVDIADDTEKIIDSLNYKKKLVNDYNNSIIDSDKKLIFDEIEKDNLAEQALAVVKQSIAKEYGGSWEDYTISNSEPGYESINWVIHRDGHKAIDLDFRASSLVNAVDKLQSKSVTDNMNSYVNMYEKVIKETVKYVGKVSDKAK